MDADDEDLPPRRAGDDDDAPDSPTSSPATSAAGPGASRDGGAITPALISRLSSLIEILEAELPPGYRSESFKILAPRLLPATGTQRLEHPTSAGLPAPLPVEAVPGESHGPIETGRLNLAAYTGVLTEPGKTRLKALAALDVASAQLGVHWMTPAEVERLLAHRAGARSIYRTNLSTALGKAGGLVDRRRRGRGYEYRQTALGRETLHRELALLGG